MADLYIHIGAPKTGTTAIQQLLTRLRRPLAEAGILYPQAGVAGLGHHLVGGAIVPARARKLGRIDPAAVLADAIAGIKAEITAHDPARVILSTEYLWGVLPPDQVRRLLEPFAEHRLHLVTYLRRQDLLAQSLYTQAVKGGAQRSFAEWLAAEADNPRTGLDYAAVLASWRAAGVPVETIVRVYERGQVDPDVTRDFLAAVCPGFPLPDGAAGGTNTSPDHVTVELVRRVNRRVADRGEASGLRRRILAASPPRETFAPLSYISGQDAAALVDRFAAGNAAIAREVLGRADGVLFREPVDLVVAAKTISGNAMLDRLIALLPGLAAKAAPPLPSRAERRAKRGKGKGKRGRRKGGKAA